MAYAIGSGWEEQAPHAAQLPARLALGASMIYHGSSKLRGDGPSQTAQMFEQLGLRPGKALAVATGIAETFAGVAAVLGLATRPAAVAVLVTQAVAIARVHRAKGYSVAQGGMEYNLALMAIAAGLLVAGPGRVSANAALERVALGRGPRRLWRRTRSSLLTRVLHAIL